MLDRDAPELALEDDRPPLGIGSHRQHAALDAQAPAATTPDRTDHDRAAAIDVAVQQRMKSDNRVVVRRRRVDEVHDDARLLALLAAGDAADTLLVDALRSRRRQ